MCEKPLLIENPYFGLPYDVYGTPYFSCPCGKCPSCIVDSANEWRTRLEIENECSISSYFVTLTYDDEHLPYKVLSDSSGVSHNVPCVSKRDVQLFLKRLRKSYKGFSIRYFLVSEYGPTTLRPHYHCILFGLPFKGISNKIDTAFVSKEIRKIWSNGNVRVDPVTFGRIAYVTKYMSCVTDLPPEFDRPFRLMSRRPGIGSSYLLNRRIVDWHRLNLACYYPDGKFKRRLPRYLKDRLFDDAMKIEIREQIQNSKNEQQSIASVARDLGYSNHYDYIIHRNEKFRRKFLKQMKKSRKDI